MLTILVHDKADLAGIAEAVLDATAGWVRRGVDWGPQSVELVIPAHTLMRALMWGGGMDPLPWAHTDSWLSKAKRGELTLCNARVRLSEPVCGLAMCRLIEW